MQLLASDDNNADFVGARDPDSVLAVTFYTRAVKNEFETSKAGRPIFQDRLYVRIVPPGDGKNIIDTFATEHDKRRFHRQWAHYEAGHKGDSREIGTPVAHWPLITPAQAEELRGIKFFTVEQIAGAADAQIQGIGMIAGMNPLILRSKAKAYLAAAAGTAEPQRQAEELAKRDQEIAELKAQNERAEQHRATMQKQLDDLLAAQKQPQREQITLKK